MRREVGQGECECLMRREERVCVTETAPSASREGCLTFQERRRPGDALAPRGSTPQPQPTVMTPRTNEIEHLPPYWPVEVLLRG